MRGRPTNPIGLAIAFSAGLALSCVNDGPCDNGACVCEAGSSCDFDCEAPPCHVDCEGSNPQCDGACGNGECRCGPGSDCEFECQSPPCHVDCEDDSTCTGHCANGVCTCAQGSDCSFRCDAGPCHVACEGDHPTCDGECSNGSCDCGPNSTCAFTCLAGPCHTSCAQGSSCTVACPGGGAGTQDCDIVSCWEGAPVVCGDGVYTVCGAPCPEPSDSAG